MQYKEWEGTTPNFIQNLVSCDITKKNFKEILFKKAASFIFQNLYIRREHKHTNMEADE